MAIHIRRREFIATLGSAAVWPLVARTQQATLPVVGVLSAEWPNLISDRLRAFHDGRGAISSRSSAALLSRGRSRPARSSQRCR